VYPFEIIKKYYSPDSKAFYFLICHGKMVAGKALVIARRVRRLGPDLKFIGEAAMLHDIGILVTDEPSLGCYGDKPYICHGYAGREILEKEGLPVHALVCERHVGAGISLADIREKNLPLPGRDMIPVSIEERIICFADKFFSKDEEFLLKEKPLEKVRMGIAKFGQEQMERFEEWVKLFGR
jgi:uncharacterized protein